MIDWKNLVSSILRPKKFVPDRCPICKEPLLTYNQGRLFACKNNHEFGTDGKRVDLINKGDHHGEL